MGHASHCASIPPPPLWGCGPAQRPTAPLWACGPGDLGTWRLVTVKFGGNRALSFHRGFWATAGISSDNWVMKVDDDGGDDGDDGLVSGQGSSAVKAHQQSRFTKPGQGSPSLVKA